MSSEWAVLNEENGQTRPVESRSDAESVKEELEGLGMDVEIVPPGDGTAAEDGDAEPVEAEVVEDAPAPDLAEAEQDLAQRTVADDPLQWMPSDFVDEIDGTTAINRKGFEVLGHFYDVDVEASLEVPPEETDFEFCRVKATATTPNGRTCEAFGSAAVDRGDDATLLLELADTRARKRCLSIATGVGAVAVAELKNEVDR